MRAVAIAALAVTVAVTGTGARRAWSSARGWHGHEWTDVAGTSMHAAVCGKAAPGGPVVVCVHGLGASHRYFAPFAQVMAEKTEVVAVDLPGFGLSHGPREALDVRGLSLALARWLEATGRQGAVLVANSAGCQVVVDTALHSPHVLGPAVLTAPTVDNRSRVPGIQAARLLADAPLERPGLLLVLIFDYLTSGPRRIARTAQHLLDDPVGRKLGEVKVPAVVVRGALDPVAPRRWTTQVAERLPQGSHREVPWGPHALNWSRPQALAAIVTSLIDSAAAARCTGARR